MSNNLNHIGALRPMNTQVFIRVSPPVEENRNGIIVPEAAGDNVLDCSGVVEAIGPGKFVEKITREDAENLIYDIRSSPYGYETSSLGISKGQVDVILSSVNKFHPITHIKVGDRVLFDISLATNSPLDENVKIVDAYSCVAIIPPGTEIENVSFQQGQYKEN